MLLIKYILSYNNFRICIEGDLVAFEPKSTKKKVQAGYKTLYITDELTEKLNNLAKKYDTSFNNIVISIIEDFFKNNEE